MRERCTPRSITGSQWDGSGRRSTIATGDHCRRSEWSKRPRYSGHFGVQISSVAHPLLADYATAVVPIDGGGDGAAVISGADHDASRADADGGTRVPPIAIVAILSNVAIATDLDIDLR